MPQFISSESFETASLSVAPLPFFLFLLFAEHFIVCKQYRRPAGYESVFVDGESTAAATLRPSTQSSHPHADAIAATAAAAVTQSPSASHSQLNR